MKRAGGLLLLVFLLASVVQAAPDGTINGTVKGSDGAPFKAAFVAARSQQTKATMWVLSDAQGRYSTDHLAPGTYEVWAASVGYKSNVQGRIKLTVADGKTQSLNFTMQKAPVQWSQLTKYQAGVLAPDAPGKSDMIQQCFNCHAFGKIGAVGRHDQDGWKDEIEIMRQVGVANIKPDITETVTKYLATAFGPDSTTPQSPSDLPAYQQLKQEHDSFGDDALNIEYVDYELTGDPRDRPGTAKQDKSGYLWTEMSAGTSRLDPASGEVKTWRLPDRSMSFIHEILPTNDGAVWLTLEAQDGIARLDPQTGKFDVYIDNKAIAKFNENKPKQRDPNDPFPNLPNPAGFQEGAGRAHTAVIDRDGNLWVSGRPLKKFDTKTKEFTFFDDDAPDTYGITVDKTGNTIWFAEFNSIDHQDFGMVDVDTDKITKFRPPAGVTPRRIKLDSKGMVWIGDYFGGSLTRFDPATKDFQVFKLPGPMPTPYGIGVDHNDNIWYASMYTDVMGKLDPKTGKITVYPSPYGEKATRDMFEDSQGRMWYGAQPYYKAGYIRLRNDGEKPIVENRY
jgi:virginiamycin B lyase